LVPVIRSGDGPSDFSTATLGEKKAKCQYSFLLFFHLCFLSALLRLVCCTFSPMAKLSQSVRIAAGSLLLLSMLHVIFWTVLAISSRANLPAEFPFYYFFPVFCFIAAAGLFGILVGVGLFRARNSARIAALVLAALVAFFCALAFLFAAGLFLI